MQKLSETIGGLMILCALLMGGPSGRADPVTVINHSFEDPQLYVGQWNAHHINGWTLDESAGEAGTYNLGASQIGCVDPSIFLDGIDGEVVAYSNGGDISQQTGATVTAGHRYTLKVNVGSRCGYTYPLYNRPYQISLAANSQTVAISGALLSPMGIWNEITVTYDSPIGDPNEGHPLSMIFDNQYQSFGLPYGSQINYDNVRLDDSELLQCEGFFSPFDRPLSLTHKSRQPIPVRMVLRDIWGNEVTDSDLSSPPVIQVIMGVETGSSIEGYDGELLPPGLADDGNEFQYDPIAMQWAINLATAQYTAAGVYTVTAAAGDGSYAVSGCSQNFERLP